MSVIWGFGDLLKLKEAVPGDAGGVRPSPRPPSLLQRAKSRAFRQIVFGRWILGRQLRVWSLNPAPALDGFS